MSERIADIGVLGLGTMGANLALNMAEKGFKVAVNNRTVEKGYALRDENGEIGQNIVPTDSIEDFLSRLKAPRL
ncbi:MAG: NAD(P)-binding domain-containing protein, partial [Microvirga sp.]|nr:NAD(P)-binding domain-containing protein [Microvirga sp.]